MFSQLSHSMLFKVALVLAAVGVVLEAGIFAYDYTQTLAPYSAADIVYSVNTNATTSALYEIHAGHITKYPAVPAANVVGVARGGGKTFILGVVSPKLRAYSLFVYSPTTKKYATTHVRVSGGTLSGLSVDPNGLYAAATLHSDATTTPQVAVITISSGEVNDIGAGYSPVILGSTQSTGTAAGKPFVSNTGYMSVVYANFITLGSRTFYHGVWSSTTTIYTSTSVFSEHNSLAGDGSSVFAFVEPANLTGETWSVKTPAPFTISTLDLFPKVKDAMLGLVKGALYGVTIMPADANNATVSVQVTAFADQSNKTTASTIRIPLKAAGKDNPSFVGTISS